MKVNFFNQPYLLYVGDVVKSGVKLNLFKVLDCRGMAVRHEETVIAVGRIIRHHNWFDTYEVRP